MSSFLPMCGTDVLGYIFSWYPSIMTNPVFQNPVETSKDENRLLTPLRDYNLLPLLAAAPQVGEKIAFKVYIKQQQLQQENLLKIGC